MSSKILFIFGTLFDILSWTEGAPIQITYVVPIAFNILINISVVLSVKKY